MFSISLQIMKTKPYSLIPTKAHQDDAGFDFYTSDDIVCKANTLTLVPTGVKILIPRGYWGHIMSRSSTLRNYGLQVVDSVIDAGYTGEMFIQVFNPRNIDVLLGYKDRIAQMVLQKCVDHTFIEVEQFTNNDYSRKDRGFGSSGV